MTVSQVHNIERFFAENQNKAFLFCQYRGLSQEDSLDVIQDAMLQFYKHYCNKPADAWAPLFFKVLRHKLIDKQRWLQLQKKIFFWQKTESDALMQTTDIELAESLLAAHMMLESTSSSDTNLDNSENIVAHTQRFHHLINIVKTLPEKQQMVFLLKTVNEFSEQHIADVMGISVGTVKQHYARARKQLQVLLGEHNDA